jgi:phosphoribosylaminoimidazolecarboxamide formyltransferase/IMP cyclohydrolase
VNKIKRALISVSDKTGVVEFAKALSERGVEILSTGGTAKALRDAKIPVIDVAEYTGSPEILDGRLKTIHPKIEGGLLGRRGDPKHVKEMEANGIGQIDLVVVNLYPFEATVAKPNCTFEDAIENIDIGGPTMIRAAAKNYEDVASVVDAADYDAIIAEMDKNGGALTTETKLRLAKKVFATTARYDAAIISHLSGQGEKGEKLDMPTNVGMTYELVQNLRYGENPHQKAAFYREPTGVSEPSLVNAKQLQGKELSYNNIMDADAVLDMVKEFTGSDYAAVVVKHANPCGAAISSKSLADAFAQALECDPISAFGGIIGLNRTVDEGTAKLMKETFFEVIAAPAFDDAALAVLAKKKNLRLIEVPGLGEPFTPSGINTRKVVGGLLVQERDTSMENVRDAKVATKRAPTEEEWRSLEFAWRICKHVKSNAIVYAKGDRTVGIGAGQMSRVDSSRIAVMKSRSDLAGSVIASDAFFPFRDGVDAAAKAGATAVVQPGGSIRDEEVIAAADENDMTMVFTGVRHFRH